MSSLRYFAYQGMGARNRQNFHYSSAVRIPAGADRIECAGQVGRNPDDSSVPSSIEDEIAQAFANCEINLKDAGVKGGWSQVSSVRSYHVPLDEKAMGIMVANLKKWCPDHAPIWTVIGVQALANKQLRVEIDVVAYDG